MITISQFILTASVTRTVLVVSRAAIILAITMIECDCERSLPSSRLLFFIYFFDNFYNF